MIDLLKGYLDQGWHTRKEVITHLQEKGFNTNERDLRRAIARYNQGYIDGKHDTYVCYSNGKDHKGFLLTADTSLIRKSIRNDEKRFVTLARRVYGVKKRLMNDDQITLLTDEQLLDMYEVIMKVNV